MSELYFTVLSTVVSVYLVIAVGFVAGKLQWLDRAHTARLMQLVVWVLIPSLVFRSVVDNQALKDLRLLFQPPLFGAFFLLFSLAVLAAFVRLPARVHGMSEPAARRTFIFSVAVFNYGFIPLPLVLTLFGSEALGVLFLHNLGVETVIWTVGIACLSGWRGARWTALVNPPSVAIALAIALNLTTAHRMIPEFLSGAIDLLANASIPVCLLLVGATIAHQWSEHGRSILQMRIAAWACLWRLLTLPLAMLLAAWAFPLADPLRQVLAVEVAMPAGALAIVLASHYGGRPNVAVSVVVSTGMVSLLTVPCWIACSLHVLAIP